MMKLILLLVAIALPLVAHAQSVPTLTPRVTLASPDGMNAAFATKADVNNGILNTPSINGGSIANIDMSNLSALASGSTTPRTFAAHFADVIHVRDYGVRCDGSTDDASAINALFAGGQVKNKLILFPAGVCVVKSTINLSLNNAGFTGAGRGQTLFLYQGANTSGDIIFVSPGTFAATIGGFDVESATAMTGGAALHAQQVRYTTIRDVSAVAYNEATNTLWNGLWIDQPDFVILNKFRFWTQNTALSVSAMGAGTSYQYDVFATDGKLYGSTYGLEISGVDNSMFDNIMDTSNRYNVAIDNVVTNYPSQEVYFGPHFVSDQASMWGLWLNDSKCSFTPNYGIVDYRGAITASGNDGVHIQNWPNCMVRLDAAHISKNGNDGVHVDDTLTHVAISSSTYLENNRYWAVNAEFPWGHLESMGVSLGNGSGGINPAYILPPYMAQTQDNALAQATVGAAPTCAVATQLGVRVYFTNARKAGEAAGSGSGTVGYCTKSASGTYEWLRVSDDTAIAN